MNSFIGKSAVWVAATLCCSAQAENLEIKERVIRETKSVVSVKLDSETVRCSDIGYGNLQLKVSVPALSGLTFFNHANRGESAPCITAGACKGIFAPNGPLPSDIVRPEEPMATTELRVVLTEKYNLDHGRKTCIRTLEEDVSSTIRDILFVHHRGGDLGTFPYEICQLL